MAKSRKRTRAERIQEHKDKLRKLVNAEREEQTALHAARIGVLGDEWARALEAGDSDALALFDRLHPDFKPEPPAQAFAGWPPRPKPSSVAADDSGGVADPAPYSRR